MALDQLLNEVREKAALEEKRVVSEAQAQARGIVAGAEEQGRQLVLKAREEGALLGREETRKVSSALLRAKRILAEEREKIISAALERLAEKLGELASAKSGESRAVYEKLFHNLAAKAVREIGEGAVLYSRPQDGELALKHAPLKSRIQCLGGVVAEDAGGRVRVDYTLDRVLEERAEELKRIAYAELFGGREKPAGQPQPTPPQRLPPAATQVRTKRKRRTASKTRGKRK